MIFLYHNTNNDFVGAKTDPGQPTGCLSVNNSLTHNGLFFRNKPTRSTLLPSIQSLV